MSGHTKGPWTFDRKTGQVDCDGGTIAHEISWAPNGPLIAAAPELLEALHRAAEELRCCAESYATGDTSEVLEMVRIAIAKAEDKP